MKIITSLFTIVLFLSGHIMAADKQPVLLVGIENNKLIYQTGSDGFRMPDFSFCGYQGGGVAIPDVPVKETLKPTGPGDDTERIQKAIDKVAALPIGQNGFRGAIELKTGTYRVEGSLTISSSGIVLRGEKNSPDGTIIIATGTKQRSLITMSGGKSGAAIKDNTFAIADKYVPVGAITITLASTKGLSVGDDIEIYRGATDEWIAAIGMNKLSKGGKDPVKNWTANAYSLGYHRQIVKITGDTITIDVPIVFSIDAKWSSGIVYKKSPDQRIINVGVEHLRLVSEYEKGKEKSDENHAWVGVMIGNLVDGWVRDVTSVHFGYSCVQVKNGGRRITIEDCACLDPVSQITGSRRYSFALGGELTLVQRCYTRHGRHDYVMHDRVRGPNVFLDCVADNTHSDTGPHHRWATGTLYDNIACGALNVQNRGRMGTGHGWAGATMVFWNCRASSIKCEKPPTANNYCIGSSGKISGNGYIESHGKPVEPRSLYLRQLEERLGKAAVNNIATPEQMQGIIDQQLRNKFGK